MSVLLPSSTLPAVMKRRTPRSSITGGGTSISPSGAMLEVPFLLAALHGRLGGLVVHARRAALGDRGHGRLGYDRRGRSRRRLDRAGAGDVSHRPETHRKIFDRLAWAWRGEVGHRNEETVPADDAAPVGVVNRGHGEPLPLDVLPDVELSPVADGKNAHVLALRHAGVVEIPQLGTLVLRIPLTELVAEREDALFRSRLLLVAARPADGGVEREFGDRFEQGHRLRRVATLVWAAQPYRASADRVLDRAHEQPLAELGGARVTEGDHLGEIVPRVDVEQ